MRFGKKVEFQVSHPVRSGHGMAQAGPHAEGGSRDNLLILSDLAGLGKRYAAYAPRLLGVDLFEIRANRAWLFLIRMLAEPGYGARVSRV